MIYVFKRIENDMEQYGFALEQSNDWLAYQKITEEEHMRLFKGQSEGKSIKFKNDATPYLADPEPQKTEKEQYDAGLISKEEYNAYIDRQRQTAYRQETDQLGMQVMRGELDKSKWLAKINEIKRRYPKEE
ncbi:MAG: hypothetical protein ACFNYQ_03590 [Treponema sp.]|jgi:hypothetical protein|uniref:hypothetical protein n=1 Tax=Treponema sp. TaxID=166 RepID=UPI0028E53DA4|nr:hypothetical protein [uncultured Treponema sp.]